MKKILVVLVISIGFAFSANAAVPLAAIIAGVKVADEAKDIVVDIYDRIPEASYYVEICGSDKCGYSKADNATEAILIAKLALENGAEWVHIYSQYPTIHKSCDNKRYYEEDIEYLQSRL
ncbi:MAG: hypothetical protein IJ352_03540 [Muribaculaceae bacterium]|nr:hypothetical protein [Muribaculaceae bacterium]